MATLLYAGSGAGAQNIGYILMAFGLGLIPYSIQYVVLRGFYAYEDTRTPFYNTVIVAAVNAAVSAVSFFVLPARWAVVGMAAAYGLGYAVGVGVAWRRLRTRLGGDLDGAHVMRTYARLTGACVPAAAVGGAAAFGVTQWLGSGVTGSATASSRAVSPWPRCSSSPPRGCGSKSSTRWSEWSADVWGADAHNRRPLSCVVLSVGLWAQLAWLRRLAYSAQRMGRRERRWRNVARLPSTWPTTAAMSR